MQVITTEFWQLLSCFSSVGRKWLRNVIGLPPMLAFDKLQKSMYLYLTPFQVTTSTGYAVSLHHGGKSSLLVKKLLRAFGSWPSIPLSSSFRVWSRLHHRPKNKACTSFTPSPFSTMGLHGGESKINYLIGYQAITVIPGFSVLGPPTALKVL